MIKDKEYYLNLREKCLLLKNRQLNCGQSLIEYVYPFIRNYKLEIEGEENIPVDTNVLFLVNHSNSHDAFTAFEVLSKLGRNVSILAGKDCLSPAVRELFSISNATLLDRRVKEDRESSILRLSNKILSGSDGLIFGESTWNLHPTKAMHNIRTGISQVSLITGVPVIPTVFEYVEEKGLFRTEGELYKKCVVRFGKPIMLDYNANLINETNNLKDEMVNLRMSTWNDYGISKDSVNPIEYINHTYLKKFKAFGFTYDSKSEQEYILYLNGEKKENEYTIDDNGNFVAGITPKNFELNKVLRK